MARALPLLRGPRRVPGLVSASAAIAVPLRGEAASIPIPMPGRVTLVAFWEDDSTLDAFLDSHRYAHWLGGGWWARLEPLRAYGTWPGLPADIDHSRAVAYDGPTVVVTLGRLRLSRAREFLRVSRRAEAAAVASAGLLWGTALACPPFVSTVSLWESATAAATYAYGADPDAHAGAIAADRRKAFHRRSAFVRFRPREVSGALDGRNPLHEGLLQPRSPADP
ncbi:MAG: hypothetical protein QOC66_591 [Pseudonocardiales bacterium]|nr:hypothetical protein [Pseudonocardiales bacterium]